MKNLIISTIVLLMFSNCSHRIVRTGYEPGQRQAGNCEVAVKRMMASPDQYEKVGEIKLGERGLSTKCNEADAMKILKDEACALDADIINITEEKRPNAWSSCYRCNAEFYRVAAFGMDIKTDEVYSGEQVKQRVKNDRGKIAGMIIGTVVGLSVFFLITAL